MREADAKVLRKVSKAMRDEARRLAEYDPDTLDQKELGRSADTLTSLADRLDLLYGEKNRQRIRRVAWGFGLYLATFILLITAFMQLNPFSDADYAKIARQLFPSAENHETFVFYLKLGGATLLSLFAFLSSFLSVMILSALVGMFRVSWLHALTEAVATALFSGVFFLLYYLLVYKAELAAGII